MDTFFDNDDINLEVLDIRKISDEALCLYDTYLEITGLEELPNSDIIYLNEVARDYYVSSVCEFMKTTAKDAGFIKAKTEGRIKDFKYFLGWLKKINKTRIKKQNYQQQFDNIDRFIEDNIKNEGFILLKSYMDEGKIPIIDRNETKVMNNIFESYTVEEINNGIENTKDFKGKKIYNLNLLLYMLKNNRADNNRLSEVWDQEQRQMDANIKSIFNESEYVESETEEDKEYYSQKNKQLIQELNEMFRNIT